MVRRTFLTVLGGGLLLFALNVLVDATLARREFQAASLPQLSTAEKQIALGSTCPAIQVVMQSFCGWVSTCQNKPNPTDCCVGPKEATCPTVQGWHIVTANGQPTTGRANSPTCPNQATQFYPCNCEGTPKSCVKKSGVPGTCPGGNPPPTYEYPNAC